MDPSAVNLNLTVDDFYSVVTYRNVAAWSTPDPSAADFNPAVSSFSIGESNVGAHLQRTGPAIYVYGASGPSYGSYAIDIDDTSQTFSAYAAVNASTPYLLFKTTNLTYANHTLTVVNLGPLGQAGAGGDLLFDFLDATFQAAPAGATVTNTTVEETDSKLTHNNTSPDFSGGGSAFTNEDGASVTLSFHGSAIYAFGDIKNDHGLYNVTLDSGTPEVFDGVSGCGGAFGLTCEQRIPGVAYFASNLGSEEHTIKIQNRAGVNSSFFDLDRFVITTPSSYAPRAVSGAPSVSGSATRPSATNGSSQMHFSHALLLLVLGIFFFRSRSVV